MACSEYITKCSKQSKHGFYNRLGTSWDVREETIPSTDEGRTHFQLPPVYGLSRQKIYLVHIPKIVQRSRYKSSLPIRILSVGIKPLPPPPKSKIPLGDTLSDKMANRHVSV